MTETDFLSQLPYILGGMFALGVLLFLLAMHQLRRRRTGSYWRVRRAAGERGGRLFLLSVALMAGSVVLTLVSGLAVLAFRPASDGMIRGPQDLYGIVLPSEPEQTATRETVLTLEAERVLTLTAMAAPSTDTPMPSPTNTLPPLPTETVLPTATDTVPPPTATNTLVAPAETLAHIVTNTPLPTETPSNTPAFTATTPPTAMPEVSYRLSIDALNTAFVAANVPESVTEFPAGTRRIFVYISFEGMTDGAEWSRALYRENVPVQANTLAWNKSESGKAYFFFENVAGYTPGAYEVRLYVGDREASRYSFTVLS